MLLHPVRIHVLLLKSYASNSIPDRVVPPPLLIKPDEGPKYKMKNILDSKFLHLTIFNILCIGRVIHIWIEHECLLIISLMP